MAPAVAEELGTLPEVVGTGDVDGGDVLAVEPTVGEGFVVAEWLGLGVRDTVGVGVGV